MLDDPLLIDDERGAVGESFRVEDAVFHADLTLKVAQQRVRHPNLFRESFVGKLAVNTDSDDLGS